VNVVAKGNQIMDFSSQAEHAADNPSTANCANGCAKTSGGHDILFLLFLAVGGSVTGPPSMMGESYLQR
jgi:hypothetical protein